MKKIAKKTVKGKVVRPRKMISIDPAQKRMVEKSLVAQFNQPPKKTAKKGEKALSRIRKKISESKAQDDVSETFGNQSYYTRDGIPLASLKGKKVEVVNLYEFLKNLSENLVYMLKRIDFIAKKLGYGSDSLFPSEFMTTNEINANVAKLKGIKE